MALTSGGKKFGIMLALICVLAGGYKYWETKKVNVPVETKPAVVEVVPAMPVVEEKKIVERQLEAVAIPIKKVKVAKQHKVIHNDKLMHKTLEKELTADQKALKDMAGDKL